MPDAQGRMIVAGEQHTLPRMEESVTTTILFNELTREEIRALAPEAIALLPVGATEQHGPHLPVGTDHFAVEHIAREAARGVADRLPIVVTPTLPFGSSHHHLPFSGTLSLGTETYYRVMTDLVESLLIDGFRRVFVLNGHGGNNELIQLAVRDLALKREADLAAASYWTIAWNDLVGVEAQRYGRFPGHAGTFETSLVMALRPELVREPRPHRDDIAAWSTDPAPAYRLERYGTWQAMNGYTDSPDRGKGERGELFLKTVAEAVGRALTEFYVTTGGTLREDHGG
ncbi:MAG: creatinine amidohydrolase [Thermomicrobiales bacterium]|nr:creatinine amidohydrolase [Thermomicrobiales bacterium]